MEDLLQQIDKLKTEIAAFNEGDAENFRIKYLGTKGLVKMIMGEMKNVAPENKRHAGQLLNEFKLYTEAKYEELKATTNHQQQTTNNDMDLTLPGDSLPLGSRQWGDSARGRGQCAAQQGQRYQQGKERTHRSGPHGRNERGSTGA